MTDPWPITLCGILMDDNPDADGVRWVRFGVEGWDSAPVRTDEQDRTGTHGSWGPAPLWAARQLVVPGRAHCPDMATAFAVRERVAASLPGLGEGTLVVHESVPKSLTIITGGQPRSSAPIDVPPYRVTWSVQLVARDPFKRALTPTTLSLPAASSITAPSNGTAAADLLVTVTTAGTVVLTAGGLTLTTTALPVGAVIDTADYSITASDGSDLFDAVPIGSAPLFPLLPKGGGVIQQAGTAGLSVTYYDTYA